MYSTLTSFKLLRILRSRTALAILRTLGSNAENPAIDQISFLNKVPGFQNTQVYVLGRFYANTNN